jgi:hypothetical protein
MRDRRVDPPPQENQRAAKRQRPGLSRTELHAVLTARFLRGKDPLHEAAPHGGLGAVANPMDWLQGLSSILQGAMKLLGSKADHSGILDIINGVVTIVSDD